MARLDCDITGANADLLVAETRRLGNWRRDAVAQLEDRAEDYKATLSPSP